MTKQEPPARPEWQGPLIKAPDYYAGQSGMMTIRFDAERHPNGAVAGIRNKPARRQIRGNMRIRRSTIELNIRAAQAARRELERLAYNSHEAARYVQAGRAEKRATREENRRIAAEAEAKRAREAALLAFARR